MSKAQATLRNKTLFITGASRGIGKSIALRAARDGAQIVVAAKTDKAHPKLPGTIHSAAAEIEAAGGKALPVVMDVRKEEMVQAAIEAAVKHFGGIDILVNNASAISLTSTEQTEMKRYDLMQDVNVRGTFMCTKYALPYLEASEHAHVLTLCPNPDLKPKWLAPHLAYSMSKFGMAMCVRGHAEEFRNKGIAVNALWPKTTIATAAVRMLMGDQGAGVSRKAEIMADAAHLILSQAPSERTGCFLLDEDVLRESGIEEFDHYAVNPGATLATDLFVE